MAGKKKDTPHCMFCGRAEYEVPFMLKGQEGYICSDCVHLANEYLQELDAPPASTEGGRIEHNLKPRDIKEFLDQYVIGQCAHC